jgi:hypothetical protein
LRAGSILFDRRFEFKDGTFGSKLIVILGCDKGIALAVKTTSKIHGRGIQYGCQPNDRFHNFYLPAKSCYLSQPTWICLDEFYELQLNTLLSKRFSGQINPLCMLDDAHITLLLQCSLLSQDITPHQEAIIRKTLEV